MYRDAEKLTERKMCTIPEHVEDESPSGLNRISYAQWNSGPTSSILIRPASCPVMMICVLKWGLRWLPVEVFVFHALLCTPGL